MKDPHYTQVVCGCSSQLCVRGYVFVGHSQRVANGHLLPWWPDWSCSLKRPMAKRSARAAASFSSEVRARLVASLRISDKCRSSSSLVWHSICFSPERDAPHVNPSLYKYCHSSEIGNSTNGEKLFLPTECNLNGEEFAEKPTFFADRGVERLKPGSILLRLRHR